MAKRPRKEDRKRWPVTNTDELTRYIARQLPELKRRQVIAVLQLATSAILNSLKTQAEDGEQRPSVTLRRFGTFELRRVKASRRRLLGGEARDVAAHWRLVVMVPRPRRDQIKRWPAPLTTTAEGDPGATPPEQHTHGSQAADVPDVSSATPSAEHPDRTAGGSSRPPDETGGAES